MTTEPPTRFLNDTWMCVNDNFSFPSINTDEGRARKIALERHWQRANKSFCKGDESGRWFNKLFEMHSDESRAYHTTVHLEEMFGYLEKLEGSLGEMEHAVLALAIFFHDAVYDAKSSTNEKDSADLFQMFATEMGGSNSESLESRVTSYILATQDHKKLSDDDHSLSLLLDMDIAVLGKRSQAYFQYASLIRKEYHFVERKVYCEKRSEILEKFLSQQGLFQTDIFRESMEKQARQNLRDEITMLRRGIIPGEGA